MKKVLSVILCFIFVFSICGCEKQATENKKDEVAKETVTSKQKVQITVVDVVENTEKSKEIELENPSPLNIAKSIIKELGIEDDIISNVVEKDNQIYVDFKKDSEFLHSGTAGETAVLDSLGLTFIGDLRYQHIYYTIEGNSYESGHFYFDKEEPYM